jgi:hypothetical protein
VFGLIILRALVSVYHKVLLAVIILAMLAFEREEVDEVARRV